MTGRRSISSTERARLFALHGGICHLCGEKIDGVRERWEVEHVIPWALTRDDSDENRRPAHVACHRAKTHDDAADIAKAKRREAKHLGFYRPARPMRHPTLKRKINGTVVAR